MRNTFIYTVISFCLLLIMGPSSYADGGGGGGFPSQSAPSFDPVEEYQEGLRHLQAERYKKAQRSFKRVLSVAKKDANAHYYLGIAYYASDKAKKARKPFEKAIKYNENNILAIGYLASVYLKTDKIEKFEEQKNKLIALKEACDSCAQSDNIDQALQLITDAEKGIENSVSINIKTSNSGDSAYISAVELINTGNYQAALASLEKSAYSFGPHPDILTYQGFANRKLGNRDLALSYYQQALSVDNEHRGANEYLGEYFVEIGDLKSANLQLAKLESICDFGCEEAEELRRWIKSSK